ncbi:hypothetical protein F5984_08360 [Rudanella paleaurantiibacter]|uniref:YfhO family protein n=1 Tax=Rudanella paleaurantiibacter TaxID=2614655 RepID=A0A7J5U332_9BACT|nr:DUF6044 family protein [Rudanella paleaurantiibacter]KAB7732207.1 hypothetical protein F5984_08360 [Rudanella paleaurantiibacter]
MFGYQPFRWHQERWPVLVGILLLLALYVPYGWLVQEAYFTIHDFLDDSSYQFGPLVQSGQAFRFGADAVVPTIMNGLPRSAMHSGLYVSVWFFALLPPFWAILVNFLVVHLVGLVSMYVLQRQYILNRPGEQWLAVGVALIFALIPAYTNYGLSVMGQPLLLLAFLQLLYRRLSVAAWLIILGFPFYSFLVRSGLYMLIGLALLGFVQGIRSRQFNGPYWLGLVLLAALYGLVDFPMIRAYLTGQFVSHRSEYNQAALVSAKLDNGLSHARLMFQYGQYHAGTFTTWPIAYLWLTRFVTGRWRGLPLWLMAIIGSICLLHGLYPWLLSQAGANKRILTIFQLDRFYFLLPFLWTLLLGLLLAEWAQLLEGWSRSLLLLLLGGQLYLTLTHNTEWLTNARMLVGMPQPARSPSFRAFYAPDLFRRIRQSLPQPTASYRVVSVGMHPIVAQSNGFYTLDSYQNNYPLPYKHQFRQLMAYEWAKPTAWPIRPYFNAYGNRCYVFPAELRMNALVGKTDKRVVNNLAFNNKAFRAMGGRFVFSAVAIKNAASLGWRQVGIFNDSDSYWQVWVYEVPPV